MDFRSEITNIFFKTEPKKRVHFGVPDEDSD